MNRDVEALRTSDRSAAAFRLFASVEVYEVALATSFNPAVPSTLSLTCPRLDLVRVHAAALFEVAVPWLGVLISRSEWAFAVWRADDLAAEERLLETHLTAVKHLKTACRGFVSGEQGALARLH